jgi:hypothetical protein
MSKDIYLYQPDQSYGYVNSQYSFVIHLNESYIGVVDLKEVLHLSYLINELKGSFSAYFNKLLPTT